MSIITIQEFKSITGITTNIYDSFINANISTVQNVIETYLDRLLDAQDYYEWKPDSTQLLTEQYPINSLKFIGCIQKMAEFTPQAGYTYEVTSTGINVIDEATFTTTTFLFSVSGTLTALKTAIEAAIPAVTLTIDGTYGTTNYRLLRSGTGKVVYGATRLDAASQINDNRTIDFLQSFDFLFYSTMDIGSNAQIYLVYNAGYATADVPKGIKIVAANILLDMINILFNSGTTNGVPNAGNIKSETVGDHSITYANVSDSNSLSSIKIAKLLENYEGDLWPWVKKII